MVGDLPPASATRGHAVKVVNTVTMEATMMATAGMTVGAVVRLCGRYSATRTVTWRTEKGATGSAPAECIGRITKTKPNGLLLVRLLSSPTAPARWFHPSNLELT